MQIYADQIAKFRTPRIARQYAGVQNSTITTWRSKYPEFLTLIEEAIEARACALEAEAWHRAMCGSDMMLQFMLKAARPNVYRENRTLEITGANGAPLFDLSDTQRAARVVAIIQSAALADDSDADRDADIEDAEYTDVIEPRAGFAHLL